MTIFDVAFFVGLVCFITCLVVAVLLAWELWEDWR